MSTHKLPLTFATLAIQNAFPLLVVPQVPYGEPHVLHHYCVYCGGKVIPGIPLLLQDPRELGLPFSMLHNAMEKLRDLTSANLTPSLRL